MARRKTRADFVVALAEAETKLVAVSGQLADLVQRHQIDFSVALAESDRLRLQLGDVHREGWEKDRALSELRHERDMLAKQRDAYRDALVGAQAVILGASSAIHSIGESVRQAAQHATEDEIPF